jgi:hypothetical protein
MVQKLKYDNNTSAVNHRQPNGQLETKFICFLVLFFNG